MERDYDSLMSDLQDIDQIAQYLLPENNLKIYIAGGSGCVLAGYIDRATRDFDFIDIGYTAKIGKLLNYLSPYDLLDELCATIPSNYIKRVKQLDGFNYINVYVLSPEDIIASKIGRYSEKDINDIDILVRLSNIDTLKISVCEILNDTKISNNTKQKYVENLTKFSEKYGFSF